MFVIYLKNKDAIITSINSPPNLLSLQMKDMERRDLEDINLNWEGLSIPVRDITRLLQ